MSQRTTTPPECTPQIIEQVARVRRSGETNMLDIAGVQRAANRQELYALAIYCDAVMQLPRATRATVWTNAITGGTS